MTAEVSHVWRSPWNATLAAATSKMRITHAGETFEIVSVIDVDERHHVVELQTRQAA